MPFCFSLTIIQALLDATFSTFSVSWNAGNRSGIPSMRLSTVVQRQHTLPRNGVVSHLFPLLSCATATETCARTMYRQIAHATVLVVHVLTLACEAFQDVPIHALYHELFWWFYLLVSCYHPRFRPVAG